MKYLIYILIIGGMAAFAGRHWIEAHIFTFFVKLRQKKNGSVQTNIGGDRALYPVGTIRTFSVRFDIIEKGNGSVDIKLAKTGKNDKIEE